MDCIRCILSIPLHWKFDMNLFKNIASDHGYTQVGGNRAFPHAFGCQDEGSCHNLNDGHVSLRATR